ncbi:hypothetical protein N475_15400 [Pseudoalteromonas luteoviolacea DSM 6061]|uniref:Uncharacterized protein n=1 Tax=Pseudoalteromonas luteoviolacea DSM 6061 TaxID=1365250 RepID=A0A166WXG0_9GAMM|nr:hypothetical protein N475_15400 [Pseudoalteromonas luteoviolacea DSM 6061]
MGKMNLSKTFMLLKGSKLRMISGSGGVAGGGGQIDPTSASSRVPIPDQRKNK